MGLTGIFSTAAAQTAATEMQFTVGLDTGYPILDLHQQIASTTLDGVAVPSAEMAHHDSGGGTNAELRVLERWLTAGSTHSLAQRNLSVVDLQPNEWKHLPFRIGCRRAGRRRSSSDMLTRRGPEWTENLPRRSAALAAPGSQRLCIRYLDVSS